ncbi:MAG: L-lactate dehydrogenase [Oscillospiraceae bacterium]|nr:L-lactate dehydrogenase [Oscillospiraceae bacterium]MBQ8797568.1 L-lactate dehydrogenase [Oscillospiraceae bacterium]
MKRKITVIGAGNVGATIAYTLSLGDLASEIVVIDINKDKVEGEVMDIVQGTSFREPISVIAGDYADAVDSDMVIITSGIGRKPGQTRLELAQTNVNILKDITPKIVDVAPKALYVIVSNPVDIMTYVFTKISGLPERQIMGSGTVLDTARLRYSLSDHFQVAQKNVHAYVYGEHGDTSFIPWSLAAISGCTLDEFEGLMLKEGVVTDKVDREKTLKYVQKSGGEIIAKKGATYYAVSASVNKVLGSLVGAHDCVATVSTMFHGEYGIDDVCISVMTLIGPNGVRGKLPVKLTDEEVAKLQASANALKEVIRGLDI